MTDEQTGMRVPPTEPDRFADIRVVDVLRAIAVITFPIAAVIAFWIFFVAVAP